MSTTHAPAPDSATACTCGRTFASHMGRRNHLTAAAKRAANVEATAARMAQVKAEAHPLTTAASRPDAETIPARVAAAILANPAVTDERVREDAAAALAAVDTCEHGIPMDAPCGPCAVAGHEPVDLDDDDVFGEDAAERAEAEDRAARGVFTEAELVAAADDVAAAHRYTVPLGAGAPPFCSCGVVGGNGITRPLLATHLRDVGHPRFV